MDIVFSVLLIFNFIKGCKKGAISLLCSTVAKLISATLSGFFAYKTALFLLKFDSISNFFNNFGKLIIKNILKINSNINFEKILNNINLFPNKSSFSNEKIYQIIILWGFSLFLFIIFYVFLKRMIKFIIIKLIGQNGRKILKIDALCGGIVNSLKTVVLCVLLFVSINKFSYIIPLDDFVLIKDYGQISCVVCDWIIKQATTLV